MITVKPDTKADLVIESNANYKDQSGPGCLHVTHYIILYYINRHLLLFASAFFKNLADGLGWVKWMGRNCYCKECKPLVVGDTCRNRQFWKSYFTFFKMLLCRVQLTYAPQIIVMIM